MYTHDIVLYQHTIHIQLYSVDHSQEPVAEPYCTDAAMLECGMKDKVSRLLFVTSESCRRVGPLKIYETRPEVGVQVNI